MRYSKWRYMKVKRQLKTDKTVKKELKEIARKDKKEKTEEDLVIKVRHLV